MDHEAPIGLIAGNGSLPVEIARAVIAGGQRIVVVAIDRQTDGDLAAFAPTRVGWGEIGRILATLKSAGCRDLVIVGGVTRPDLAQLRPDLGLFTNLPALLKVLVSGGDDGVLRAVVRFFEAKGFNVVSPAEIAPGLVVGAGRLTAREPSLEDTEDILLGSSVVQALGAFDVGQAVIVADGRLIAVEAAEGTDRMLARVAEERRIAGRSVAAADAPRAGVLVKRPKPGQEMRVDLPAIGPLTVDRVKDAGLKGIAVQAGVTLAAERGELLARAGEAQVFVYGFTDADARVRPNPDARWRACGIEVLGRLKPRASQIEDVRRGASVLGSLAGLAPGAACVVNRGYVLGLDPAGTDDGLLARSVRFKQWGEGRWRRRMAVAVLADARALTLTLVRAAQAAKLAGLAVMDAGPPVPEAIAAADAAGLFVLQVRGGEARGKA